MSRDMNLLLTDILDGCRAIEAYGQALTFHEFARHAMAFDAIVRQLAVIGEAASHIPDEARTKYPHVGWRKIIDLRNIVVHKYFGIDDDILWDVIHNHVPQLQQAVTDIISGIDFKDG